MNPVDQLVAAFGGIRPMAYKLGEMHASLVQGWQNAGLIPHYREAQIRAAAQEHGVKLPEEAMAEAFRSERKPRRRKAARKVARQPRRKAA